MKILWITILTYILSPINGQIDHEKDALFVKSIHDQVLLDGACYGWLEHLSEVIGGRLAGSAASEKAIYYTKEQLNEISDTTYLQKCEVPYWTRGAQEKVVLIDPLTSDSLDIGGLALGNSIGTGPSGVSGDIVEVRTLDEVRELGPERLAGRVVFYNRPMDPTQIRTFYAYGGAVDQRVNGPSVAAAQGAIAVLVRSMTTAIDDYPHTGVTRYDPNHPEIPAIAISTKDAELLHEMLVHQSMDAHIVSSSEMVDEHKNSYNVIAEIKGTTYPDEIILVGGHLDSWDVGGGAHDDGAGCVHSMQVLHTLHHLGYRPQRTIRCVLFMNEENGLGGGLAYADESNDNGEWHMAAIESDAGGFTPRGFSCDATDEVFAGFYRQVTQWEDILDPYYLSFTKGGSGADISPLKSQEGLLFGFRPDSQRYFDFHHTAADRIEAVNERELKLGAAAMTSLVYLLDKYGLAKGE